MYEQMKTLLGGRPIFTRLDRYDADTLIYDHVASSIKHRVTDVIEISSMDLKELFEIIRNIKEGDIVSTPSDIIFANTLPLNDFTVIQKTEYHDKYESVSYTFNVYDIDYPTFHSYFQENHNIDEPSDVEYTCVYRDKLKDYYELREKDFDFTISNFATMTIVIQCKDGWTVKFVLPLECNHESIKASRTLYSYEGGGKSLIHLFMDGHYVKFPEDMESELFNWANLGVVIFYTILVALLNPCIKDVFQQNSCNPSTEC